jgi:hypothetical protein
MNLKLNRTAAREDGIFGVLLDDAGHTVAFTLERAYPDGSGWAAKVASGVYICVRHPPNRLPYTTFMLTNVPPFQGQPVDGILIHIGNYNKDSIGCILLGESVAGIPSQLGADMLINSKKTFQSFMNLQNGIDEFTLTVTGV